jgi:hypothetical protein
VSFLTANWHIHELITFDVSHAQAEKLDMVLQNYR